MVSLMIVGEIVNDIELKVSEKTKFNYFTLLLKIKKNELIRIFVQEELAKETSVYLMKGMLVSVSCDLIKGKYSKYFDTFNLRANKIDVIYINKSEYALAKKKKQQRNSLYNDRLPF